MVLTGYLLSIAYAAVCIIAATLFYKLGLPKKYTRKIVHILVGFEWFILYHYMGAGIHFLAVCLLFLALLAVAYKVRLLPMISSDADNAPGTVYYAVAMSGVAAVGCFVPEVMLPFGIGVVCTSLGDGFAGVIGQLVKKYNPVVYCGKTLLGCVSNFLVSTLCAFALSQIYSMDVTLWQCVMLGVLSVELELVTGYGLDNITVTWGVTALAYAFMYFGAIGNYLVPILISPLILMLVKVKDVLTTGGIITALTLDAVVSVAFGNFGFVILCVFFITSIFIDKIKKRYKNNGRVDESAKGDRRDYMQVMANGLVSAIAAAAFALTSKTIFLVPFVAGLAEAMADTAASGIGAFADNAYDPFRRKKCENGMSGGMSLIGTLASLVGALLVSTVALTFGRRGFGFSEFWIVSISAFSGAVVDSLLGSLVQVKYTCEVCGCETEKEEHCGKPTRVSSGLTFIDNDIVNIISCSFSAILATVLAILI